jgi:hypothetical protein
MSWTRLLISLGGSGHPPMAPLYVKAGVFRGVACALAGSGSGLSEEPAVGVGPAALDVRAIAINTGLLDKDVDHAVEQRRATAAATATVRRAETTDVFDGCVGDIGIPGQVGR